MKKTSVALVCLFALIAGVASAGPAVPWAKPSSRAAASLPAEPIVALTTVSDPTGDTIGSGAVQHDITSFTIEYDAAVMVITLVFNGAVAPPTGGANDVVGFIELDTDQNVATGTSSAIDIFSPHGPTNLGVEAELSFFGQAYFFSAVHPAGLPVPTQYGGNSLTFTVPTSALADDGVVNAAAIIGTIPEPTDIVPNGGFLTSSFAPQGTSVPTLSPVALAGLALLLLLGGTLLLGRRS